MDKVAKCGVMDNILSFAAFKNQKELKKSDGAKRSRLTGGCSFIGAKGFQVVTD
jgi:DNA topoisomerase-2